MKNVQNGNDDCDAYEVSRCDIEALRDVCKSIVEQSQLVDGLVVDSETLKGGFPSLKIGAMHFINRDKIDGWIDKATKGSKLSLSIKEPAIYGSKLDNTLIWRPQS